MTNLNGRNPISTIKAITTEEDTMFLLSNRVASLNFDGFIPRDNTLVYVSDLTIGQTVFSSDPTARNNSFFITRIDTATTTVEDIVETKYSLFYLGQNDLEEQYTYGAENIDGSFSQNHLFNVYKDDISDIILGNNGWMLTNEGNAVFSNVFVRGTIEATSGKIDGILRVGESSEGLPLVTIGKDIFNSTSFEGSTSQHSGIFLNKSNYLMAYDVSTNIPITSIIVTNNTEDDILRKATFTLVGHTLAVNDLVSISGFAEDKFMELDNVFPVKEITTDTFTIYYKNPIAGTTNPITVDLKVESFALNNIYQVTSFSLSEIITAQNTSSVKVYFNGNYTPVFTQNQLINLNSILNPSLGINGQHKIISVTNVVGEDYDYLTINTQRLTAGTYSTDLGQITLYDTNYKFKVGDVDNSMSYNSFTGILAVTGEIHANTGSFTNTVSVGSSTSSGLLQVGTGTNTISIYGTGTDTTSAIFAGAGNYGNADTGFFMDASGRFSLKDKLTFSSAGDLTVTGTVNASAGNFTNTVTIGQSSTQGKLQVGTGTSYFEIIGTNTSTTTAIKTNGASYGTSGVWLDASGRFSLGNQLTFADGNLTITGGLTATSLTVGTDPNQIIISPTAVSGNPGMAITGSGDFIRNTGAFRLGGASGISYSGSGTVTVGTGVNVNGNISGASGTFGGSIKIGSGESVFVADSNGIYLGNETFASAEFRVTPSGSLTASSANVTGTINASDGIFSGNIQTTGKIYSGNLDDDGLLTSGIEVASTGIKGIIGGITAFSLPADGVTKPVITNFEILNAQITGDKTNAFIIAGNVGVSADNIVVRGYRGGTDATAAIYNTKNGTPTTFAGGTGFYLNDNGYFKVGTTISSATFDPTANTGAGLFSITGEIKATSGWIGGAINGWQITDALIQSTDRTGSDNQVHLETGTGQFKSTSKVYIGPSGSEWNTGAPFYADSDGYFSVGAGDSSLTYDPGTSGTGLITVTGKVQATSGYIGGKDLGWKFGNNGILQTGEGQGKLALASSVTQFSGGLASLSIERILCDNEFEDYQANFGSVYVTVKAYSIPMTRYVSSGTTTVTGTSTANHGLAIGDKIIISEAIGTEQEKLNGTWTIASTPLPTTFTFVVTTALASATYTANIGVMGVGVSSGIRDALPTIFTDTIMKFDLTLAPTSSFKTIFDGKSFSVVDVIESKKVFFVKEIDNYDPDGGFPEISSPQATWDLYPAYGSATSTQLSLYFTEIFTDNEFTSTTGGLAVGNTLTLEADVLPGVNAGNYVIAAIGTQDLDEGTILYGEADGYNARFGKLTLTRSGSVIALQESGVGGVYLPDPAGYYTLIFYPEDSGVVINNTAAEGYYSYTTSKPQLSFYDELALTTSDGYYYMWAGDDDPDLAEFVIKKSNAVNANNLTVQNKALGQSYVSQSQESTFAPFSVTGATTGSSFVPMIKSRVTGATKTRISVLGQIHNTDNTINTVLHNLNSDGTEDQKFYFRNDGVFQAPEFVGKGAVPVGSIVMWYQTSIPTGWLRCDGAAVSSTSYPSLYAMMTNTPNLTGRFPLGVSGTTYPLGGVGGAASASYVTVTAHSHTINAFNASITEGTVANNTGNHSHGVSGNTSVSSNDTGSRSYSANLTNILTPTVAHSHGDGNLTTPSAGGTSSNGVDLGKHTHSINAFNASVIEGTNEQNTAANGTVATMPPYLALYFIIYAG
jgi:microcystin-dependent protein